MSETNKPKQDNKSVGKNFEISQKKTKKDKSNIEKMKAKLKKPQ